MPQHVKLPVPAPVVRQDAFARFQHVADHAGVAAHPPQQRPDPDLDVVPRPVDERLAVAEEPKFPGAPPPGFVGEVEESKRKKVQW